MSSPIARDTWDNSVIVTRDGTTDATWDGRVKNLVYNTVSMAWEAQTSGGSSGLAPTASYDAITLTQASTTDVYRFYTGGTGGTLVETLTITYTDSGKGTLSSVVKT